MYIYIYTHIVRYSVIYYNAPVDYHSLYSGSACSTETTKAGIGV